MGRVSTCRFDAVPVTAPYDLIINATSAGVKGETPPYPAAAVSENTFCYDLSYGISPTPFSVWAREHNAEKSVMGWGMLVEQAAESFNIWRGIMPDTAPVLRQMAINA
jgi:shikimate dehydrogenase